ncbi:LOW QUALITY PROTEIN: olfactory receptor 56B2-like [Pholidichthys leucotaenia]
MPEGNQSTVKEFILTGFPGLHPKYSSLASAVLFFVYLLTMTANGTTIFLFGTNRSLHKPIYYIIVNLSVCDILFSTTALPKIISKYWFQSGTIFFFAACFVQMCFVHYLCSVNSFILFLMDLDRYLAICHPLRYPNLLKKKTTIFILSITVWITAKACPLMIVIRAYPLHYCASNIINHCYCDHIGITVLACTDRTPYSFPAFVLAMVVLLGPLAFISFSYFSNIIAIETNSQGHLKCLSTCTPQLIIIALYYLPRCFVYLASNVGIKFNSDVRIVVIMLYSLVPLINPLIYCLRAKDMRESLWKQFHKRTAPQKAHISAVSN